MNGWRYFFEFRKIRYDCNMYALYSTLVNTITHKLHTQCENVIKKKKKNEEQI